MRIYNNLRISQKLFLSFAILIILAAGSCLLGIRGMSLLEQQQIQLYESTLAHSIYISEAYAELLYHNRRFYRHILVDSPREKAEILAQAAENEQNLVTALDRYRSTPLHPAESELLANFDRVWPVYLEHKRAVFQLSDALQKQAAEALAESGGRPSFKELDRTLSELLHYNLTEGKQSLIDAEDFFHLQRDHLIEALLLIMGIGVLLTWRTARGIVTPLRQAVEINEHLARQSSEQLGLIETIASGDLSQTIETPAAIAVSKKDLHGDEAGDLLRSALHMNQGQVALSRAMAKMTAVLQRNREDEIARDWLKSNINAANLLLRGDHSARQLTQELLTFLATTVEAATGAAYLFNGENDLELVAGYALPAQPRQQIRLGEGVLGEAARECRRIVLETPHAYLRIESALGSLDPCMIAAIPLVHDGELLGAMELGGFRSLDANALELLDQVADALALALKIAKARGRIEELLEQAQQQTEELRVQQEELQQSNEELEERAQLLEQQREQISAQNREIEQATEQVKRKAEDLERVSAYKSEFLANMSHELRSPLNSLLILSGLLQENREGHLSEKEIQFASTINAAGKDLLTLINDILDLSKVEAGRLDLHAEPVAVREVCDALAPLFLPQCEEKGLAFQIAIMDGVPESIQVDRQRLQQILRNLLSNACKFTESGEIRLAVRPLYNGEAGLKGAGIAFEVRDTGIGVAPDKQQLIFEAFQQADGSTSRKFGGTGLGLSIAQQLARRMGGTILLSSVPGDGSRFTLCLPVNEPAAKSSFDTDVAPRPAVSVAQPKPAKGPDAGELPQPLPDDRAILNAETRTILVIEDDARFAQLLIDMVRERHFAALAATDGETGIALADRYQPNAILLDVMLPHIDGWTVMRHLKDNPRTRHIPVHFVTCLDEERKALAMGAVGYIRKPVTPQQLAEVFATIETAVDRTVKRLLVVEDNQHEAEAMVALLSERNVEITVATSGKEAVAHLGREHYDCIVIDLGLADMAGFALLEHIRSHEGIRKIPVIIHSGQELSREDEHRLRRYAESIIIKGVQSPDRLLNEVTLFLHLVESGLSPGKQQMIRLALDQEAMLSGKKVLIVDDDMRNIFSLSSILAEKQLDIYEAENGREALARLDEYPEIDLVLMDIMMPEMDGYETMRAIRRDRRFGRLPIIAMTAKALKGDQEKCLAAGASDYLSKPIDTAKLFSLLRVWLYPGDERR